MSNHVSKHANIISADTRATISMRYKTVTKAINQEFWDSSSDTLHSRYVGSYGRNTAVNTSDIDILVELPEDEYYRFDSLKGNGQSRLLQAVKNAIISAYPRSSIQADGQVIQIHFSDGMEFEILPAFKNSLWNTYKYPDTNMGGNWRTTNPIAEQEAMKKKNSSSNGLLCDTCKHIRTIHNEYFSSYHLSGIVIDSFVYEAMGNWQWTNGGDSSSSAEPGDYEKVLLEYFNTKTYGGIVALTLNAPGSRTTVNTKSSYDCLGKVLNKMV